MREAHDQPTPLRKAPSWRKQYNLAQAALLITSIASSLGAVTARTRGMRGRDGTVVIGSTRFPEVLLTSTFDTTCGELFLPRQPITLPTSSYPKPSLRMVNHLASICDLDVKRNTFSTLQSSRKSSEFLAQGSLATHTRRIAPELITVRFEAHKSNVTLHFQRHLRMARSLKTQCTDLARVRPCRHVSKGSNALKSAKNTWF